MNNNENYNSENNFNYSSFVENNNCNSESNNDKNDFILLLMQKTSKIINIIINQIMQINFTTAEFLANYNQNN